MSRPDGHRQAQAATGERRFQRARVRILTVDGNAESEEKERAGDVVIHDLSRSGILVDALPGYQLGDLLVVDLPDVGSVRARVRRIEDGRLGCEFVHMLSQADFRRAWAGSKVVWPDFGSPAPFRDEFGMDHAAKPRFTRLSEEFASAPSDKLPLPVRAGLAIGLATGLWSIIILALR